MADVARFWHSLNINFKSTYWQCKGTRPMHTLLKNIEQWKINTTRTWKIRWTSGSLVQKNGWSESAELELNLTDNGETDRHALRRQLLLVAILLPIAILICLIIVLVIFCLRDNEMYCFKEKTPGEPTLDRRVGIEGEVERDFEDVRFEDTLAYSHRVASPDNGEKGT